MRLTPADVREAAERARLRVDDADVARLAAEIGGVLAWADALLPPLVAADAAAGDERAAAERAPAGDGNAVAERTPARDERAAAGDRGPLPEPHPHDAPTPLRADTPVPSPGATLLAGSAGWDGLLVRVPAAR